MLSFLNVERRIILHTVFLFTPFSLHKKASCFVPSLSFYKITRRYISFVEREEALRYFYTNIRLHCMLGYTYVPVSYFASFHYHTRLRRRYLRFIKKEGTPRYIYNDVQLHCKLRYPYVTVLPYVYLPLLHFLSFSFLPRLLVMP